MTTNTGATRPDASADDLGFRPDAVAAFRYVSHDFDASSRRLTCRYALDDLEFEEIVTFGPSGTAAGTPDAGTPDPSALANAARMVFLLAGISYFKAAAPPRVEIDLPGLTPAERALLTAFYLDGLGEYAFRNELDLSHLVIDAADRAPVAPPAAVAPTTPGAAGRVLVPFGGGIDSIVTVEGLRSVGADIVLFVVSREGDRFDAIETAAAVTGLDVVRAERRIDPKVLRSRELGFRNGHVPVTGVISAIAVMAAVLDGRSAVVMSNEWSAGEGNVTLAGRVVNHQWSKTLEFEDLFRAALAEVLPTPMEYYSWLRPFTELWVAERFAALDGYHRAFRSCNRAFHIDRALRWDHWCGECDKCCFIDLILSPYLPAAELREIFRGDEPLENADRVDQMRTLAGLSGDTKPFECVGDVDECRVALLLAAARSDRADDTVLQALAAETRALVPGDLRDHERRLHQPIPPHRIPTSHAPADLLG